MSQLVEVLFVLCRKGFENSRIYKSRNLLYVGKTFREVYELEENGKRTPGDFGSETGKDGEIVIFKRSGLIDKAVWIREYPP